MTQKDIEKLNAYVSTKVSKYNDFMNDNPLEIYLVSSNNEKMGLNPPINQIGLNEFCGLYNKINELIEIHTPNEAIDKLKDYGWASFVGNDKINYIFLSDPKLTNENDKDKDIKEPLSITRNFEHEFGHYKQKIFKQATSKNCNRVVLEYHNIMFNENNSTEEVHWCIKCNITVNKILKEVKFEEYGPKRVEYVRNQVCHILSKEVPERMPCTSYETIKEEIKKTLDKNKFSDATRNKSLELIEEMFAKVNPETKRTEDYDMAIIYNMCVDLNKDLKLNLKLPSLKKRESLNGSVLQ